MDFWRARNIFGEGLINKNNAYGTYCWKSLNKVHFSSAVPVIPLDHQATYMFTTCVLVRNSNDASQTFNLAVQSMRLAIYHLSIIYHSAI